MPSVTHDDAPLLADLMPWSVAPPRLGRAWPTGPDAASLKARWDAFVKAEGPDRDALLEPTRSRTLHSAVGQLPGQTTGTEKLIRASGPCPEPVRVLHAPFDEQWLIPDHRLIDAARPELWRVADERQVFVLEIPDSSLLATSLLPLLRRAASARCTAAPEARNPTWPPACCGISPPGWATPPRRWTCWPGSWPPPAPTSPFRSRRTPDSGRVVSSRATACCG